MAEPDVVRITTARSSAADDMKLRKRRYAWSMSIRLVCFLAAVIVGSGVFMWLLIAGAVFLPYIAVVMANAVNAKDDGFSLMSAGTARRELSSGPEAGGPATPPG